MARILVADDDADLCDFIGEILEATGHEAVCVKNADEALRQTNLETFNAILLDLRLGLFWADELVDLIRVPGAMNHATPILIMSGDLGGAPLKRLHGNVAGFLSKPFDLKTLAEALRDALVPLAS